jgi:hypothetical protein
MPKKADGFRADFNLPPQLTVAHVRNAIRHIETRAEEFLDVHDEQANVFSALIGILGVQALHFLSPYKKHRHPDQAQQRFPDLSLGGRLNPPPRTALESKGTSRPWALQSHYNHPGWYIVWRYAIDPTRLLKPRKIVVIWRVDLAFLPAAAWKYEGSGAREGKGGRTHTFGVKQPKDWFERAILYQAPNVILKGGGPTLAASE